MFEIFVTPPPEIVVELSVGQGPAGPPGSSEAVLVLAGQSVNGHRVVCAGIGGIRHIDASVVEDAHRAIGLSLGAASAGDLVAVAGSGPVDEQSWNWTPDQAVYCTGAGLLTQTVPSLDHAFILRVGVALSATKLFVNLGEPVIL